MSIAPGVPEFIPVPAEPLAERAASERDKLARLKQRRGTALLDGGKLDHRPVVDAEQTIEAIADAEGEQVRRERAAAAAERAAARAALMVQIGEVEDKRLAAIARFAKHSLERERARDEALASARRQAGLWKELGDRVPAHLDEQGRRLEQWDQQAGIWAMRPAWLPAGTPLVDAERGEGERATAAIVGSGGGPGAAGQ